jgi:ABC-type Na+ efflux pump permease subunit
MESFRRSLMPVKVFAKVAIRRAFRDKTALFFIFLFPLIFLFVFGGIFGKNSDVSFRVALINQSESQFAKQFEGQIKDEKVFKVDEESTTMDAAKEKMNRGQLEATIVLPPGFGDQPAGQPYPTGEAKVLYTQNNAQAGQTLGSLLQEQFKGMNAQYVNAPTPFTRH